MGETTDAVTMNEDEKFMRLALASAAAAAEAGEVPVGAVAVRNGEVVAVASNAVESKKDASCHAELELLRHCAALAGDWRMEDLTIYVTKEPCAMCAGAMVNARVKRVVFGMADERSGACGSALNITGHPGMLWQVEVTGNVLADECKSMFQDFFRRVRRGEKKKPAGLPNR